MPTPDRNPLSCGVVELVVICLVSESFLSWRVHLIFLEEDRVTLQSVPSISTVLLFGLFENPEP